MNKRPETKDSEQITEEFFRQRFPEKEIKFEKKSGYFDEWKKRFESGNPESYMDDISLKVWREMRR